MDLEVLMSTMGSEDTQSLVQRSRLSGAAIIVNQCGHANSPKIIRDTPRVTQLDSADVGLSQSRNEAIGNATADICLLADDDEVFVDAYEDRVLSTFLRMPNSDVIAFTVNERTQIRKAQFSARHVRGPSLMRISSVQIAFRLDRVRETAVEFDTNFGAGARFRMGEELIWLNDLVRAGLRVASVPLEVAHLEDSVSTWFTGYDAEFFRARGASFARAQPRAAEMLALQWAVRKRGLYSGTMRPLAALQFMLEGIRLWRENGLS